MNNDNNKEEQKTIINIPGVIIPPQKTENGTVISSAVDDSHEVPTEVNTDKTVNGLTTSNAPDINTTPVTEAPITNPPTNAPITTPPITDIPVTTTKLDKNGKPIKEEKKKSKSTILVNSSLVGIIVLLLIGLGYFVYKDYLKPQPKVDPVKEYQRKRTANKNSYIVNMLYQFVNLDGCGDQADFFYAATGEVTYANLTDENKNYLAYRMLRHGSIKNMNCATFPNALHSKNPLGLWYCGNYDETGKEEETTAISEDDLKDMVNRMFGEGTYKAKSFGVSSSARYMYNETNENYVYQTFNGDNRCTTHTNTLTDSYQQGNNLTIVVKVTNDETKAEGLYYYTFTESDDGNYYFNNLVKKAI